jgi:hypothetical protein
MGQGPELERQWHELWLVNPPVNKKAPQCGAFFCSSKAITLKYQVPAFFKWLYSVGFTFSADNTLCLASAL